MGLPTPTEVAAKADLDLILATLSPPEILACRAPLRAHTLDCRSSCRCLMAVVARQRGCDYWDLSEVNTLRPFELWAAAYIHPYIWAAYHQQLDQWLTEAIDGRVLELPYDEKRSDYADAAYTVLGR